MMRLDELKDQLRQLNEMIRVGELQGDAARRPATPSKPSAGRCSEARCRFRSTCSDGASIASPDRRPGGLRLVVGGAGYAWLGNREGLRCHLECVLQPIPAARP